MLQADGKLKLLIQVNNKNKLQIHLIARLFNRRNTSKQLTVIKQTNSKHQSANTRQPIFIKEYSSANIQSSQQPKKPTANVKNKIQKRRSYLLFQTYAKL